MVAKFRSAEFARVVDRLVRELEPEWIHCGHPALLRFVPRPGPPLVFDVSDVVHEVWDDFAAKRRWPLSALARLEARRVRRFEQAAWRNAADAVIAISHHDAKVITRTSGREVVAVPPEPSPRIEFVAPSPARSAVGMIGNWTWPPNRDGLEQLAESVLPAMAGKTPGAAWIVAGRGPDRRMRQALEAAGVEVMGPVADPMDFYRRVGVVVAPYSVGCGIRLKLLDAVAAGCALVATPTALRGLPAGLDEVVEPKVGGTALAGEVRRLVDDDRERERRAMVGLRMLSRLHSPEQTVERYRAVVERLRVDVASATSTLEHA